MWWEQGFLSFSGVVVGGFDGCERGDRGCGWCRDVDVLEVACVKRMGVGVGSAAIEKKVW